VDSCESKPEKDNRYTRIVVVDTSILNFSWNFNILYERWVVWSEGNSFLEFGCFLNFPGLHRPSEANFDAETGEVETGDVFWAPCWFARLLFFLTNEA